MKKTIKFIEQPDGFVFLKIETPTGLYKFWLLPTQKDGEFALCFDINSKIKTKGELGLRNQGGQ